MIKPKNSTPMAPRTKQTPNFPRGAIKFISQATLLLLFSSDVIAQDDRGADKIGNIVQFAMPITAYASTFAVGDPEGRTEFYKSFATSYAITSVLKVSINKPKPENHGDYSFPSGHTSVSFQSATFVAKRYGWKYGIPAYLGATYVGWSRVKSDQHDSTDVVAGAAIGILSSYYFTTPYRGLRFPQPQEMGYSGLALV